jgi:phosphoribosylglycinamide formyltransferase-1
MKNIAIFASGSGTNAENLIRYFQNSETMTVPFVLSNKAKAYVHQRAKSLGVPSYTFTKEEFTNGTVLKFLQENQIDFIVLAGYMLMIDDDMLAAFPLRIVNIHPSLLPKYGGKGMHGDHVHQAVVAAGEKESGITIHYLNDEYDAGDVVFQAVCEVLPTDTPDDVAAKVHALEYEHYPKVVEKLVAAL